MSRDVLRSGCRNSLLHGFIFCNNTEIAAVLQLARSDQNHFENFMFVVLVSAKLMRKPAGVFKPWSNWLTCGTNYKKEPMLLGPGQAPVLP
jgi:hypothetical protein